MKQKITSAALVAAMLCGCGVSGTIKRTTEAPSGFDGAVYSGATTQINKPVTDAQYRVFNQAATGFVSVQANLEDATYRANRFCEQRGEKFRVISETTSQPPHALGNFPRAEVTFECVAAK